MGVRLKYELDPDDGHWDVSYKGEPLGTVKCVGGLMTMYGEFRWTKFEAYLPNGEQPRLHGHSRRRIVDGSRTAAGQRLYRWHEIHK